MFNSSVGQKREDEKIKNRQKHVKHENCRLFVTGSPLAMRISYWIGVWAQVLRTGFIQKTGLLARSNFQAMAATVMQRE